MEIFLPGKIPFWAQLPQPFLNSRNLFFYNLVKGQGNK